MELNIKPIISTDVAIILKNKNRNFWCAVDEKKVDLSLDNLKNGGFQYIKEITFYVSLDLPVNTLLSIGAINEAMYEVLTDIPQIMITDDAEFFGENIRFGSVTLTETSPLQEDVKRKLNLVLPNTSVPPDSTLWLEHCITIYFFPNQKLAKSAYDEGGSCYETHGASVSELYDYGLQFDCHDETSLGHLSGEEYVLRLVKDGTKNIVC